MPVALWHRVCSFSQQVNVVESETICPLETDKLQLRTDKEQQQGHPPSDGQGWQAMPDSFHDCMDRSERELPRWTGHKDLRATLPYHRAMSIQATNPEEN